MQTGITSERKPVHPTHLFHIYLCYNSLLSRTLKLPSSVLVYIYLLFSRFLKKSKTFGKRNDLWIDHIRYDKVNK